MLNAFETIARREGVSMIELLDASKLQLFRVNAADKLENPMIRSTLLCTLMTGEPSCYYKDRGFVYSDKGVEADVVAGANQIMELNVGSYIESGRGRRMYPSSERWEDVKTFLNGKGTQTKFYTVFRELHDSAERGNSVDRQMLIDIVANIHWVPGYYGLISTRRMKNMLLEL
jgi:hypothetical protein